MLTLPLHLLQSAEWKHSVACATSHPFPAPPSGAHIGSFKSPIVEAFTPQKWANATNQGFFSPYVLPRAPLGLNLVS